MSSWQCLCAEDFGYLLLLPDWTNDMQVMLSEPCVGRRIGRLGLVIQQILQSDATRVSAGC